MTAQQNSSEAGPRQQLAARRRKIWGGVALLLVMAALYWQWKSRGQATPERRRFTWGQIADSSGSFR